MNYDGDPACWSWDIPNVPPTLRQWHAGRCGICGRLGWHIEDHDHETWLTRGYLCGGCNVREGKRNEPIFVKWRQRPSTQILGLAIRYYGWQPPSEPKARPEEKPHDFAATDAVSAYLDSIGFTP